MATLTSTNRMSAKQLVISQNSALEFVENPKSGKLFFVCGAITGYVSPAVRDCYESVTLDQMQFAEVSKDGAAPIPCLMMVGDSKKNVKRSLGADLL